jgi:hypothetical protein
MVPKSLNNLGLFKEPGESLRTTHFQLLCGHQRFEGQQQLTGDPFFALKDVAFSLSEKGIIFGVGHFWVSSPLLRLAPNRRSAGKSQASADPVLPRWPVRSVAAPGSGKGDYEAVGVGGMRRGRMSGQRRLIVLALSVLALVGLLGTEEVAEAQDRSQALKEIAVDISAGPRPSEFLSKYPR